MTNAELGNILNDMYENAPRHEQAAMIHLFGIKYADQIKESPASFKDIANAVCIYESYDTEISKGTKLAKYFTAK